MRIRLFLTSMLAVMVACPAFADPVIGPYQNEASCSGNTINNARPGDTVTYVADYEANHYKVIYDPGAHAASGVTSYEDEYDATNAPNAGALYDSAYAIKSGGGANAAESQTRIYAADGYEFTGWQSNYNLATGEQSSTPYSGDGNDSVNQYRAANVVTLTAQYGEKEFTIHYWKDAINEGEEESQSVYYTGNAGNAKSADTFSKTGYTFDKWSSDHNINSGVATTTPYAAGVSLGDYNVVGDTHMIALWNPYTGTVTYDCGTGATGTISTTTALEYDQPFSLERKPTVDANCTKNGYTFTGWSCTHTVTTGVAGTTVYAWANNAVTNGSGTYAATTNNLTITCYAQWLADPVYLKWYDGEDEVSDGQPTCEWNDGSITTIPHPTKRGYTFKGWNIVPQE